MTPTRISAATETANRHRLINARRWFARGGICRRNSRARSRASTDRTMTKRSYRFAASVGPSGGFDGDRPGVREARESAQRVLDDLVQGRAVLLLQRRLPDEIRSEAGALSTRGLGATRETGRLLSPSLRFTRSFGAPPPAAWSPRGRRGSRSRGPNRRMRCRQAVRAASTG